MMSKSSKRPSTNNGTGILRILRQSMLEIRRSDLACQTHKSPGTKHDDEAVSEGIKDCNNNNRLKGHDDVIKNSEEISEDELKHAAKSSEILDESKAVCEQVPLPLSAKKKGKKKIMNTHTSPQRKRIRQDRLNSGRQGTNRSKDTCSKRTSSRPKYPVSRSHGRGQVTGSTSTESHHHAVAGQKIDKEAKQQFCAPCKTGSEENWEDELSENVLGEVSNAKKVEHSLHNNSLQVDTYKENKDCVKHQNDHVESVKEILDVDQNITSMGQLSDDLNCVKADLAELTNVTPLSSTPKKPCTKIKSINTEVLDIVEQWKPMDLLQTDCSGYTVKDVDMCSDKLSSEEVLKSESKMKSYAVETHQFSNKSDRKIADSTGILRKIESLKLSDDGQYSHNISSGTKSSRSVSAKSVRDNSLDRRHESSEARTCSGSKGNTETQTRGNSKGSFQYQPPPRFRKSKQRRMFPSGSSGGSAYRYDEEHEFDGDNQQLKGNTGYTHSENATRFQGRTGRADFNKSRSQIDVTIPSVPDRDASYNSMTCLVTRSSKNAATAKSRGMTDSSKPEFKKECIEDTNIDQDICGAEDWSLEVQSEEQSLKDEVIKLNNVSVAVSGIDSQDFNEGTKKNNAEINEPEIIVRSSTFPAMPYLPPPPPTDVLVDESTNDQQEAAEENVEYIAKYLPPVPDELCESQCGMVEDGNKVRCPYESYEGIQETCKPEENFPDIERACPEVFATEEVVEAQLCPDVMNYLPPPPDEADCWEADEEMPDTDSVIEGNCSDARLDSFSEVYVFSQEKSINLFGTDSVNIEIDQVEALKEKASKAKQNIDIKVENDKQDGSLNELKVDTLHDIPNRECPPKKKKTVLQAFEKTIEPISEASLADVSDFQIDSSVVFDTETSDTTSTDYFVPPQRTERGKKSQKVTVNRTKLKSKADPVSLSQNLDLPSYEQYQRYCYEQDMYYRMQHQGINTCMYDQNAAFMNEQQRRYLDYYSYQSGWGMYAPDFYERMYWYMQPSYFPPYNPPPINNDLDQPEYSRMTSYPIRERAVECNNITQYPIRERAVECNNTSGGYMEVRDGNNVEIAEEYGADSDELCQEKIASDQSLALSDLGEYRLSDYWSDQMPKWVSGQNVQETNADAKWLKHTFGDFEDDSRFSVESVDEKELMNRNNEDSLQRSVGSESDYGAGNKYGTMPVSADEKRKSISTDLKTTERDKLDATEISNFHDFRNALNERDKISIGHNGIKPDNRQKMAYIGDEGTQMHVHDVLLCGHRERELANKKDDVSEDQTHNVLSDQNVGGGAKTSSDRTKMQCVTGDEQVRCSGCSELFTYQYVMWKICKCAENPVRVHQVMPGSPDDPSLDHGYHSHDSTDVTDGCQLTWLSGTGPDSSHTSKQLPHCSTPADSYYGMRPPPGFELFMYPATSSVTPDLKKNDDRSNSGPPEKHLVESTDQPTTVHQKLVKKTLTDLCNNNSRIYSSTSSAMSSDSHRMPFGHSPATEPVAGNTDGHALQNRQSVAVGEGEPLIRDVAGLSRPDPDLNNNPHRYTRDYGHGSAGLGSQFQKETPVGDNRWQGHADFPYHGFMGQCSEKMLHYPPSLLKSGHHLDNACAEIGKARKTEENLVSALQDITKAVHAMDSLPFANLTEDEIGRKSEEHSKRDVDMGSSHAQCKTVSVEKKESDSSESGSELEEGEIRDVQEQEVQQKISSSQKDNQGAMTSRFPATFWNPRMSFPQSGQGQRPLLRPQTSPQNRSPTFPLPPRMSRYPPFRPPTMSVGAARGMSALPANTNPSPWRYRFGIPQANCAPRISMQHNNENRPPHDEAKENVAYELSQSPMSHSNSYQAFKSSAEHLRGKESISSPNESGPEPTSHSMILDKSVKRKHDGVLESRWDIPKIHPQVAEVKLVDYGSSEDSSDYSEHEKRSLDDNVTKPTEESATTKKVKILNKIEHLTEENFDRANLDGDRTDVHTDLFQDFHRRARSLKQKNLRQMGAHDRYKLPEKQEISSKVETKPNSKRSFADVIGGRRRFSEKLEDVEDVDETLGEMQEESPEHVHPPLLPGTSTPNLFSAVAASRTHASMPPLPPFPGSPFWSMYLGNTGSALLGHNPSEVIQGPNTQEHLRRRSQDMAWQQKLSPGLFRSPSSQYYSPGQAVPYSPSETDSDSITMRPDWRNNFIRFHSFGVKYIDTHCHLDFLFSRSNFKGNLRQYMDTHPETFPNTFDGCVAVFCNPASFTTRGGLWLEVAKEDNVWIAMGCHPKMATEFTYASEQGLRDCLKHEKCVALGEIGLDYSGTFRQHEEVQKRVFRCQLKIAMQMKKPLVIHCRDQHGNRDAENDCLSILKELVPKDHKIHCHCFTSHFNHARLWLDAYPNLYIGLTPLVTYRSASESHNLARLIPLDRLLLETDAPYFVPRCIRKEDMALSNPGLAITVAKEVAHYQNMPVAAVLRHCRTNTKAMYGI